MLRWYILHIDNPLFCFLWITIHRDLYDPSLSTIQCLSTQTIPSFTNFPTYENYIIILLASLSPIVHTYFPLIMFSIQNTPNPLQSFFRDDHQKQPFFFTVFVMLDSHTSWLIPYLLVDSPKSSFFSVPAFMSSWILFHSPCSCLCLKKFPYSWFLLIQKGWPKCCLFNRPSSRPCKCPPFLITTISPVNLYTSSMQHYLQIYNNLLINCVLTNIFPFYFDKCEYYFFKFHFFLPCSWLTSYSDSLLLAQAGENYSINQILSF